MDLSKRHFFVLNYVMNFKFLCLFNISIFCNAFLLKILHRFCYTLSKQSVYSFIGLGYLALSFLRVMNPLSFHVRTYYSYFSVKLRKAANGAMSFRNIYQLIKIFINPYLKRLEHWQELFTTKTYVTLFF